MAGPSGVMSDCAGEFRNGGLKLALLEANRSLAVPREHRNDASSLLPSLPGGGVPRICAVEGLGALDFESSHEAYRATEVEPPLIGGLCWGSRGHARHGTATGLWQPRG